MVNFIFVIMFAESSTWTKPVVQGLPPLPRSLHSANVIGNRYAKIKSNDFGTLSELSFITFLKFVRSPFMNFYYILLSRLRF